MTRVVGRKQVGGASPVTAAAVAMMDRCEAFVLAIPAEKYAVTSKTLKGGTIGKHIRHTLDHFRAALEAVSGMVIDYDHRERDVPMETEPREAIREIKAVRARILNLDPAALETVVRVRIMVDGDGTETELGSTLARELAFVSHHAVHHHAMLGAIATELGVVLDQDFGKAPSTVSHERGLRSRAD